MHNQFKSQKFKHLMLAMGPRDLNSAPYSPVHCSSHSMTSFQSSELTELPVVENGQLFAQRTVRPQRMGQEEKILPPAAVAAQRYSLAVRGPQMTIRCPSRAFCDYQGSTNFGVLVQTNCTGLRARTSRLRGGLPKPKRVATGFWHVHALPCTALHLPALHSRTPVLQSTTVFAGPLGAR